MSEASDPLLDVPAPPERVCAVCGYTLEHMETLGYVHLGPVAEMHDHVAVPVDPADVSWSPDKICDFCSQMPAPWVIIADDFIVRTGGFAAMRMQGNWYACPPCAELVHRRQWAILIDRVVGLHPHIPRRGLQVTYTQLERHMKGIAVEPAND